VTSAEQVRRALGKLSEAQYEKLAAQVDRFVKTDVVIGDDAAAHRSRAANTALRDRVIHALHRTGGNENEARRLAYELGILRTRGLPGGSGYWNYPSSYSPRDDDDLLYRDDTRDPDEIFEEGFRPKSPEAEVSHYRHMMGHPETSWVSTSRRSDLRKVRGYRYEVDAPGSGLDAEHEYGSSYPFRSEREVAFDGGIDRTQILGAGEEVRPPRGLASWGADDGSDSFYLVNPHFRFPSEADEYSWPASGYEPSIPDDRYSSDDERPSSPWSSWHHQNDEDDEE
jgi:hypothetical protein